MILLSLDITVITNSPLVACDFEKAWINHNFIEFICWHRFRSLILFRWIEKCALTKKGRFRHYKNTRFHHSFQKYCIIFYFNPRTNCEGEYGWRVGSVLAAGRKSGKPAHKIEETQRRTHVDGGSGGGGGGDHDGTVLVAKIESTDLGIGSDVVLMSKLEWKC